MGIARERAVTYENDCKGVAINYETVGRTVMKAIKSRDCRVEIDENWADEIVEYRKSKKAVWKLLKGSYLKIIIQLLKDIDRNGYDGIGKPERLSGDLSAYWSRRIDEANRIVYRIEDNVVKIVQCGSHYRDK